MTVRPARPADARWKALADELAPAKSLQRLDAAGARVVSTVSVVASVLTGLGLLAAGASTLPGAGRALALVAAVITVAALVVALRAQTVSISRDVNLDNLAEVEAWYRTRFEKRAPRVRRATILIVVAVGFAGLAAVVSLLAGGNDAPTIAVTRTAETVTVDLAFRGLEPAEVATATVRRGDEVVAQAVLGPGTDGTATRTITAKVPGDGVVRVEASGGGATCTATLVPDAVPAASCAGS